MKRFKSVFTFIFLVVTNFNLFAAQAKNLPPGSKVFKCSWGEIYLPSNFESASTSLELLIHFHGAAWLIEQKIESAKLNCVLLVVSPGGFSSAYQKLFSEPDKFDSLLIEVLGVLKEENAINKNAHWHCIGLSGFSAGYGAIRAILREEKYYQLIDFIALADGLHSDITDTGTRTLLTDKLEVFRRFALDAVAGKKTFLITHSSIQPPDYASTTETANYLIEAVGGKSLIVNPPQTDEGAMALISTFDKGNFQVRGYSGTTAPDHMHHLYNIDRLFAFFRHPRSEKSGK